MKYRLHGFREKKTKLEIKKYCCCVKIMILHF